MRDVIVLGAGMAGLGAALALQGRGRSVALLDRTAPGRETSYGNAGIIQAEAVEPYALPRSPRTLLRMGLKLDNALNYHLGALPGQARDLFAYFRNSAPHIHMSISAVYRELARRATADHGPLIEAAGADHLIRRDGFLQVYRSEDGFASDRQDAERLRRSYGVNSRFLDPDALAEAEPHLRRRLAGAIQWTDAWSCSDPGALVTAYADLFRARGGEILQGDAASLRQDGAGWRIESGDGPHEAQEVVVALGPWSPILLARFGYRVPMVRKRGYHRHVKTNRGPNLPMVDVANSSVLAPMRAGLRILTGAELAGPEAPPTPRQLAQAERGAADLFELGEPVESVPWLGVRPCLPDMLPLVGPAPRHDGMWFCFGHGHQGFTQGPTTGELLADAMEGARNPVLDALAPAQRKH